MPINSAIYSITYMKDIRNSNIMTFISLYLAQILLISSLLSRFSPGGWRASYLLNIEQLELGIDLISIYLCLPMYILLYFSIYVHNMC